MRSQVAEGIVEDCFEEGGVVGGCSREGFYLCSGGLLGVDLVRDNMTGGIQLMW